MIIDVNNPFYDVLVVCPYTSKPIPFVFTIDTAMGAFDRFVRVDGPYQVTVKGPNSAPLTERVMRDYDVVDRLTGEVLYEVRPAATPSM